MEKAIAILIGNENGTLTKRLSSESTRNNQNEDQTVFTT